MARATGCQAVPRSCAHARLRGVAASQPALPLGWLAACRPRQPHAVCGAVPCSSVAPSTQREASPTIDEEVEAQACTDRPGVRMTGTVEMLQQGSNAGARGGGGGACSRGVAAALPRSPWPAGRCCTLPSSMALLSGSCAARFALNSGLPPLSCRRESAAKPQSFTACWRCREAWRGLAAPSTLAAPNLPYPQLARSTSLVSAQYQPGEPALAAGCMRQGCMLACVRAGARPGAHARRVPAARWVVTRTPPRPPRPMHGTRRLLRPQGEPRWRSGAAWRILRSWRQRTWWAAACRACHVPRAAAAYGVRGIPEATGTRCLVPPPHHLAAPPACLPACPPAAACRRRTPCLTTTWCSCRPTT